MIVVELAGGVAVVPALLAALVVEEADDEEELEASWTPRTMAPPITPATSPTSAVCHSLPRGERGDGWGVSGVLVGSMGVGELLLVPGTRAAVRRLSSVRAAVVPGVSKPGSLKAR
jgi:hypothetical protein